MDRVIVYSRPDGSVVVTSPYLSFHRPSVLVSAAVPDVPAVTRPETDAEATAALVSAAVRAATPEALLEALRAGLPAEVFGLLTGNGAADTVGRLVKAPPAALLDILRKTVELEAAKPEVPEIYRDETDDEMVARVMAHDLAADAISPALVDRGALPAGPHFRECWAWDGTVARVDMDRARAAHLVTIRAARDSALAATDVRALRDMEAVGQVSDAVKAQRQALRDIPTAFDLSQATTPEALAALWPPELPPRPVVAVARPAEAAPRVDRPGPSLSRPPARGPRAIAEGVAR